MAGLCSKVKDVKIRRFSWRPIKLHSSYWSSSKVHKRIAEEIIEHFEKSLWVLAQRRIIENTPPPEVFQQVQGVAALAGFSNYIEDFNVVPFRELITTAKTIDILLVYGRTWIQQNAQYFVEALNHPETAVRVCTLSPESSALAGFCYHFDNISQEELKRRIEDASAAWKKLIERGNTQHGSLKIYRSLNIITHSFYRFDDKVYFVPRCAASDRLAGTPIPTLVYRKTSQPDDFFSWLTRDFELLIKTQRDARPYYDSTAPQPALPLT